jgi:hypothetical protein
MHNPYAPEMLGLPNADAVATSHDGSATDRLEDLRRPDFAGHTNVCNVSRVSSDRASLGYRVCHARHHNSLIQLISDADSGTFGTLGDDVCCLSIPWMLANTVGWITAPSETAGRGDHDGKRRSPE